MIPLCGGHGLHQRVAVDCGILVVSQPSWSATTASRPSLPRVMSYDGSNEQFYTFTISMIALSFFAVVKDIVP